MFYSTNNNNKTQQRKFYIQYIILALESHNHDHFSQMFVISTVPIFVTGAPEFFFQNETKFVIPSTRFTEKIYMQFTSQIQGTGLLVRNSGKFVIRGVRYSGIPMYISVRSNQL